MKGERGFTLVEALIAFAILAVTLVALYEAMGTSVRGMARASQLDEAVLVAESRLAELSLLRSLPAQLEGESDGYRWRVTPIEDEGPEAPDLATAPLRAQKVKLTVARREAGVAKEIAVERVVLLERQPGR
jgi:general secretion pathway protein I